MNVRVDNRYVYKYLEEQHQRDAARTLGVQAENKKKEVPFLLARYGGIALIILFIGLALYLANSYKKILDHSVIGDGFNEGYYGMSSGTDKPSGTDDIIDIESLLEDNQAKDHFQIENNESIPPNVVRNYVIFDRTDFNIGNMNAVIGIAIGDKLLVVDEIKESHDTDSMAQEIKRRYPQQKIYVYPDASGGNRSTNASKTDIQILESYGFINQSALSNPPVRDRVNSVQRLLENGKGQIRLQIHSSATKVIECLELQSYTEKGDPDKDAGYDHMNDALGYITWRLFNPLHMGAGRKTGIRLY